MVLICDDPDAPMGTLGLLWVVAVHERIARGNIKKEVLGGVKHGINDFPKYGYGGPCPHGGTHRYFFKLFAVDKIIEMEAGASEDEILNAIKGHILAEGQLIGRYSRQ